MRSSIRVLRTVETPFSQAKPLPYVCSSCRHHVLRQRNANHEHRRHASSGNTPFTEKIRRKLWGTDNPPGPADPYDVRGSLEHRTMRIEEERREVQTQDEQRPSGYEAVTRQPSARSAIPPRAEAIVEDAPAADYVPAETWDGLQHVGHTGHWSEFEPAPEDSFVPFLGLSQQKASSTNDFLSAIHQATVEVITLQCGGQKLDHNVLAHDPKILDLISKTKIKISQSTGAVNLHYPSPAAQEAILSAFKDANILDRTKEGEEISAEKEQDFDSNEELFEATGRREDIDAEIVEQQRLEHEIDAAQQETVEERSQNPESDVEPSPQAVFYAAPNEACLHLTLKKGSDESFALIKRITQLTGLRIPDPTLNSAKTLRSIFIHQLRSLEPKPKTLAEELLLNQELASLPNVKIFPRRQTPVDKEKEVGRWKVIEAELRSRGLPVLGKAVDV